MAPRVELRADTHSLNVRLSNSPSLPLHSVEILSIQSMGFKLQLITPCRRCVLQRSSVVPHIFWFLSSGCGASPDQLKRCAQEGQHLTPPSGISTEPAPPPLLWSTGSRPPPQLVRQNGVRSIHKIKPCLKVISYASSHTELSAQPSSSPDVAERLTAAVSTRSLRYQFNHRLTGTDSYRNSSFGHKSLFTSLLSLLHPT